MKYSWIVACCVFFHSAAFASLIQNPGFDECADPTVSACLDGWETFTTEFGAFDTGTSVSASNGGISFAAGIAPAFFFSATGFEGGGVSQSFDFSGGEISFFADLSLLFNSNRDGGDQGRFELRLLNNNSGDSNSVFSPFATAAFTGVGAGQLLTSVLDFSDTFDPGNYTLSLLFTQPFIALNSPTFSLTNFRVTTDNDDPQQSVPVPTPATLGLFALGVIALWRRRST